MKFSILGFSQKKLIEFGLDSVDALILRYFIDFRGADGMVMQIHDNKPYYWLKYQELIKQIPIIKIKNKDALRRRLKKLEQCEVLEHYHKKIDGSYSFYTTGKKYTELITKNDTPTQKSEGHDSKVGGVRLKSRRGTTQKSEHNINLLKDKSIKEYSLVISYLNQKAGTKYKDTTKKTQQLINARLTEGFTKEDFYTVVNNKVEEWKGTDMEKFLRPETLFGNKFEGYLNQKHIKPNKQQEKTNNNAYKPFEF